MHSPCPFTVLTDSVMLQKRILTVKEKITFALDWAHCASLGGSLALPESAKENQRIMDELGKNSGGTPSLSLSHERHCVSDLSAHTTCALPSLIRFATPLLRVRG